MDKYELLLLKNQLCFPLYACSKEVVRRYRPYLDPLDLTYTQYLAMMVFWEENEISIRDLGKKLYLDSGTLTPVLKVLEQKGYIDRVRSKEDERLLLGRLTEKGLALREKAVSVPQQMSGCVALQPEEMAELNRLLQKILAHLDDHKEP